MQSCRSHMFFKIGVLKNFANFTETPMLESLLNKVAVLEAWNFIKKRLQHRCFLVNFAKFLRTSFLQNTSGSCFWKWKDISSSLHFLLP